MMVDPYITVISSDMLYPYPYITVKYVYVISVVSGVCIYLYIDRYTGWYVCIYLYMYICVHVMSLMSVISSYIPILVYIP
jgi:hypothetical protein